MPVSPQTRARATQRRQRCVQLAAQGHSYDEIAKEVGYTHRSAARKALIAALDRVLVDNVQQYRALELDRLDALQDALWDDAISGDMTSVDRVLKIITARCRLLGLDQHGQEQGHGGGTAVSRDCQGPIPVPAGPVAAPS